jgi:transposase
MPAAWAFITAFPTPAQLAQAGRTKWIKFLHLHKLYRPQTVERRLAIFAQAAAFQGRPEVVAASQQLAVSLVALLRTLHAQLKTYRQQIRDVFTQHPDHALFASLPGPGEKLAPRLLAEFGDDRARFAEPQALQCYAGSAPVTFASGQMHKVHIRRACNTSLRATVHLWANLSRAKCAWAQAYYQAHRDRGQSHACALRCLSQRWLAILWRMWQDHTLYDPELHLRSQLQHGSWVLKLTANTT